MSSTTTTSRPAPTGKCANLYDTPVRDAVCAMPYNKQNIGYMAECCKSATIYSYYDECGLYCLAEDQKVEDLSDCLYKKGAEWEDVFCRGDNNATATGDGKPLPSASAATIGSDEKKAATTSKASKDNDDEDDDDKSDDNDDESKDDKSDASSTRKGNGLSKMHLLLCSLALAAVAI